MADVSQPRRRRSRWLHSAWAALAALAVSAGALPAFAGPRVEWDAPESCPNQSALSERLNVLLGEDADRLGGVTHVRGVVSKDAAAYHVVLEVTEAERRSSRSFSAEDCADLLEAAALAIALSAHAGDRPEPALPEATPRASAASPARDVPVAPASPTNSPTVVRWAAGAEGVLDTGALPQLAPGFSVLGGARLGALSLSLHGTLFPTQQLQLQGGEQVEFGLMVLGLRSCYSPLDAATRVGACAGFEAGQFNAAGATLDPNYELHDGWLAPSLAVEGRQRLARSWQLVFRGEAVFPLLRKQYVVNENERIHAPSSVDVRLSLGLSVGSD